jgi:phosphoglucomutase
MEKEMLVKEVKQKAQAWLDGKYDEETKNVIRDLMVHHEDELIESFYKNLEFGTGGLRGIMGVGTNRINIYTISMATQGLSNYLKSEFTGLKQIKVAIAYDCRNNSRLFAETTANVFAANGFKVYLFEELKPTPELSFAIRHFECQSGVVITASHNPKEYNGYKAYWEDGGQIISPHDKNIIAEVEKITSYDQVLTQGDQNNIEIVGNDFDELYTDKVKSLSLSPEIISKNNDLKIVFTPIHGTGVRLVPMALHKFGFKNVFNVPKQDEVNGDFPTVHSPNPEEAAALDLALKKAEEIDADLIMGTDPDCDRVGIAVKNNRGEFTLLNGNQTAAIFIEYLLSQWSANNKLTGKEYIVKTIVTTELLTEMAEKYRVDHYHVLTGFKYIANVLKQNEGKKTFIGGGEESYGYLAGEFVRDKDAVISCALIAEVAAFAKNQGKSLFDLLLDIYVEYHFYKERLISVVRKGKKGEEEIKQMMESYRLTPPAEINGSKVMVIHDYLLQQSHDKVIDKVTKLTLPKSDVLQFITGDGSKISVRPSGTEPKIKFYFSVKGDLQNKMDYEKVNSELEKQIDNIIRDMQLD